MSEREAKMGLGVVRNSAESVLTVKHDAVLGCSCR